MIKTHKTVTLTNSLATTEALELNGVTSLQVSLPAGYVSTTLTVYSFCPIVGDYLALRDSTNTAVVMTVAASRCQTAPAAVLGCDWVKFVTNSASDNAVAVGTFTLSSV